MLFFEIFLVEPKIVQCNLVFYLSKLLLICDSKQNLMVSILFSLFSGVNLAFAIFSFFIYRKDKNRNEYLYFFIFSLFSGLYFLFQSISVVLDVELGIVAIFSAAMYYAVFPWFLFEFVGEKPPKKYLLPLSGLFFTAFLMYVYAHERGGVAYWQIIAHLGLIGLIICVFYTSMFFRKRKRPGNIQMTLFGSLFIVLSLEEIIRFHFNFDLLLNYDVSMQPLDIYPLLFTVIMGLRMSQDFVNRKRAEMDAIKNDLNEKKLRVLELEQLRLIKEVNFKKRDLTDFGIEITRKRKYIKEVLDQLIMIKSKSKIKPTDLDEIIKYARTQLKIGKNLDYFQEKVEEVNHEFNTHLKQRYPSLTESEMHLASLLRLKLNTKEIASIKNVSPDSVKVLRYRLRKKFQLENKTNLVQFLQSI